MDIYTNPLPQPFRAVQDAIKIFNNQGSCDSVDKTSTASGVTEERGLAILTV